MPTSPSREDDLARLVEAYRAALAEGCAPLGAPVGTGRRSAANRAAEMLGRYRGIVMRDLREAERRGMLEKPRVRVQATGAPVQAPREAPPIKAATPMQPAYLDGAAREFTTDADHTFTFGACGDAHLGSKYERLDVLAALYDAYAEAGCRAVFNTGNWIDGEARFNVHDLHTRGMEAQVRYLARTYPVREGITTYAVTGDDHEGWYAQREGVDIGRHAERAFRDAGRADWINLGYMEAPCRLVNAGSGAEAVISVTHPGGGSAYALSYTAQKIIESLDGGEKPAVLLYGHYHKLLFANIRNVWAVSTGCTQDQTPFMRKKKLEAHVGGAIVRLTQDPETGAIVRCRVDLLRFFNRGYYRDRWSPHGDVHLLPRAA